MRKYPQSAYQTTCGLADISDHVSKRDIVISKAKPKSAGITIRVNKPSGAQLAHYKLGRHKSSIRPRSSVAYTSPTVSKTV